MAEFFVNVQIAAVRDEKYLTIIRGSEENVSAGLRPLPGGKADPELLADGAFETTARRELMEEVGVAVLDPVVYVRRMTFEVIGRLGVNRGHGAVEIGRRIPGQPRRSRPGGLADYRRDMFAARSARMGENLHRAGGTIETRSGLDMKPEYLRRRG